MNEINNESKNAAIKTLAIIGFVGVIVLCVWLAVQVVRILPTAFSSLASIAESIDANRPTQSLEIESEKRVINSNQSFTLNWVDLKREGSYIFSYVCTEGISVDIRFPDESLAPVGCEDGITIEKGVESIDVFVSSEKQRFTDVAYTLSFVEAGSETSLFERNGKITVVNASIPAGGVVAVTPAPAPAPQPETPAVTPAPAPTPTPAPAPAPKPITRTVTYVPVSDPNGYTDLRATIIAVGEMDGKTFVPTLKADNDERGAIQIEVKNFGTKTSADWDFSIKLPDGSTYTLDNETELKPNERSILTIGFNAEDLKGSESFSGKVTVSKDTLTANNSFAGSMTFVD